MRKSKMKFTGGEKVKIGKRDGNVYRVAKSGHLTDSSGHLYYKVIRGNQIDYQRGNRMFQVA